MADKSLEAFITTASISVVEAMEQIDKNIYFERI